MNRLTTVLNYNTPMVQFHVSSVSRIVAAVHAVIPKVMLSIADTRYRWTNQSLRYLLTGIGSCQSFDFSCFTWIKCQTSALNNINYISIRVAIEPLNYLGLPRIWPVPILSPGILHSWVCQKIAVHTTILVLADRNKGPDYLYGPNHMFLEA
jgi:hypothetical protein